MVLDSFLGHDFIEEHLEIRDKLYFNDDSWLLDF